MEPRWILYILLILHLCYPGHSARKRVVGRWIKPGLQGGENHLLHLILIFWVESHPKGIRLTIIKLTDLPWDNLLRKTSLPTPTSSQADKHAGGHGAHEFHLQWLPPHASVPGREQPQPSNVSQLEDLLMFIKNLSYLYGMLSLMETLRQWMSITRTKDQSHNTLWGKEDMVVITLVSTTSHDKTFPIV